MGPLGLDYAYGFDRVGTDEFTLELAAIGQDQYRFPHCRHVPLSLPSMTDCIFMHSTA